MKIGVLINDLATEQARYTTTTLVRAARARRHEVYVFGVADFVYDSGHVRAWARRAPEPMDAPEDFLEALRSRRAAPHRISVDDLDVLLLRNNPAEDAEIRPWATSIGFIFGEQAVRRGVLVLNQPSGLARALSKLYLECFPPAMRPVSVVTRHAEDVRRFVEQHGTVVVKPLTGFGGRSVFVLRGDDADNFNQIVEAVTEHGYVVVQEYLARARQGDIRMMLLDGVPLEHDGRIAAMRRVAPVGELRNNVKVGAHVEPVRVTDEMRRLAELARPRLVADGMWLVGLDVVGDVVMEVNVFSPGGLLGCQELYGIDFAALVVEDLERKVARERTGDHDASLLATV